MRSGQAARRAGGWDQWDQWDQPLAILAAGVSAGLTAHGLGQGKEVPVPPSAGPLQLPELV